MDGWVDRFLDVGFISLGLSWSLICSPPPITIFYLHKYLFNEILTHHSVLFQISFSVTLQTCIAYDNSVFHVSSSLTSSVLWTLPREAQDQTQVCSDFNFPYHWFCFLLLPASSADTYVAPLQCRLTSPICGFSYPVVFSCLPWSFHQACTHLLTFC